MFHIDKNGKRARCRAIVRHCPLGGEVTLMRSTGVQGPARPDAAEAKDAGVYDAFYGDALEQRKLAQERKRQRDTEQSQDGEFIIVGGKHVARDDLSKDELEDAERAAVIEAQRIAEDQAAEQERQAAYVAQLDEVKTLLENFEDKHERTLIETSQFYFTAREKLRPHEQEYLDDVDHVGQRVTDLVKSRITLETIEEYNGFRQKMHTYFDVKKSIFAKYDQPLGDVEDRWNSGEITREEMREQSNALMDQRGAEFQTMEEDRMYTEQRIKDMYRDTYAVAYKQALEDVGVEFADGNKELPKLVKNLDDHNDEEFIKFNEDAVSLYPKTWVDAMPMNLTLHGDKYTQAGYLWHSSRSDGVNTIELHAGVYSTTVHEWAHAAEKQTIELGRAQRLFLMQEKQHSSHKEVREFNKKQKIATDSMVTPYSGVYYVGRSDDHDWNIGHSYEVLTTGTEALFARSYGGFEPDETCWAPRHRNFILGLFATEGRPYQW